MQCPVRWEQKILRGIDMSFTGTRPTQRSLTSLVLLVTLTVLSFLFWSGLTHQSLPIWHFRCPVLVQQGDAVVGDALSVGDCIFKLCVYSRWPLVARVVFFCCLNSISRFRETRQQHPSGRSEKEEELWGTSWNLATWTWYDTNIIAHLYNI